MKSNMARARRGGKAPTLGNMSYLFQQPKQTASELRTRFFGYVMGLPNAAFLTDKRFTKQGLQRVIHKFRNAGAHDSPIRVDVCRECIEVFIGDRNKPGYVPRVAAWRVPALFSAG
ncbi:MAG: hypothetical protein HYV07_16740 [Deltaproteobacteria bacterium]|nr:hypothetical protein [Deltaproteobacteria bacterium]